MREIETEFMRTTKACGFGEEGVTAADIPALRTMAEANNADALYLLGSCLLDELIDDVPTDVEAARGYLTRAAALGMAQAAYDLGLSYGSDMNGPCDEERSFLSFLHAAEMGHVEAMRQLAGCYGAGMGTKHNYKLSRQWWEKAATAGDEISQTVLAASYHRPWYKKLWSLLRYMVTGKL